MQGIKMTKFNATLNPQDEIALDDLFAEIDDGLAPVEPCNDAKLEAAVEPIVNADEELLEALLHEEVPSVETKIEKDLAVDLGDTDLDGLFDENDLDLDSLTLDVEMPIPEEEPKKEKPAPTKKEKSPSTYRTTYYNSPKSKVLLDRLGDDKSDIVLEFSDAELSERELKIKQNSFLSVLNNQPTTTSEGTTVQKKVAEKVIILFTMFKQKKDWNEVMYRTFKLLLTDGYLNVKKGGNLYNNLLAKPYSSGTANAQMGQMAQMLPLLKICHKNGEILTPNEDSTILARLKSEYFPELITKDSE